MENVNSMNLWRNLKNMREMFDKKSELCLCGSGKKYSECCAIKISICGNSNSFRGFMQEFDKLHNTYKKICLHPNKSECSRVKTHACIFRKNRALAPHERSAVPLGTDHCPVC